MSTIQAPTYNRAVYQGTHGNVSVAVGQYTCAATAKSTVIQLISLPAGCRISTVLVYTDTGLGASVGVTVAAGDTTIATVADMSAATSQTVPVALLYNDTDEVISATITGAEATGDLIVEVFYIYEGTL
ncbi:TPA: hypothetical protein R4Y92_001437 [Klebsiella aerogenes]|nr:hypothetical protein [Klebsiella aerogenes]